MSPINSKKVKTGTEEAQELEWQALFEPSLNAEICI